jgi:hypothetical protein
MIAETITYKIDDDSFKGGFWGSKCSVDVTFSYKDYHEVVGMREEFLGPADFNTLYMMSKRRSTPRSTSFSRRLETITSSIILQSSSASTITRTLRP